MTTSTNNSNDSQQVLQQLQSEQSTLPLLYLPHELAEETSLYFQPKEAARILSVSRSFYNLFIHRVWYDLESCYRYGDRDNFEQWFKKYGQYVRLIDPLLPDIRLLEPAVDWLKYVSRATKLAAIIRPYTRPDSINKLIKCLQQIKTLRIVSLRLSDNTKALVEMVEIAKAINELVFISCINIRCLDYKTMPNHGQWMRIIEFVEALFPSKRSKLELQLNIDSSITAQQVKALAPYLTNIYAINRREICMTKVFQGIFGSDDAALTFPRLGSIRVISCCLQPQVYVFNDVAPVRFPRLHTLHLIQEPCVSSKNNHEQIGASIDGFIWKPEFSNYAHVAIPSYHWPNLVYLNIGVISSERLMNIIRLHPQLQCLTISPSLEPAEQGTQNSTVFYVDNFSYDVFKIDEILEQLPRLRIFRIDKLHAVVDADFGSIPLERRHKIEIHIRDRMAVTPAAIKYLLQMQQLNTLWIYKSIFVDIDATIECLRASKAISGVRSFDWQPIDWNQELLLAMTAKMPNLARLSTRECPDEYRAIFEEEKYEFTCYC
ncbi:hypothetical protein GQ42DRAFT_46075 [Ramicandelaber brevisporus]|nr:hypothetical protein GQ42DRAFT_46075 [Ramicandelaber brevisporus]